MINSYRKGRKNEQENRKFWEKHFPYATFKRVPNSGGLPGWTGDHLIQAPYWSFWNEAFLEDKNAESWKIEQWIDKATKDAKHMGKRFALLDITKNRAPHLIVLTRETFVAIIKELEGFRKDESLPDDL
jgi:hypothetical protein